MPYVSLALEMAAEKHNTRLGVNKKSSIKYHKWIVIILGFAFGIFHRWHVSTLHENGVYFSHLSNLEREMTFRSEMGLYYSYYKTIVESKSFAEGLDRIRHDNLSQYGDVIDASAEYNIVPEIAIGYLYHAATDLGILPEKRCWMIERKQHGLSPVKSCVGLRVPVYFYLEAVWLTATVAASTVFYYATYLSGSIYGGLVGILLFLANHNDCTRVQWTPPLREHFGYPLLLFQMYTVTRIIRKFMRHEDREFRLKCKPSLILSLILSTALSLCTWQFSQFVFVTQVAALLALRWLRILPYDLCGIIGLSHIVAIAMVTNFSLASGRLLLSSLYMCLVISSGVAATIVSLAGYGSKKRGIVCEIAMTIVLTKYMKFNVLSTQDDGHVFNILRSKLTDYRDFHTMLYTCSAEFDFLEGATVIRFMHTKLLFLAIVAGMLVLNYWHDRYKRKGYPRCVEAHVAYNVLQTGAFVVMAVLIMRLKLFMTPHLCIMSAVVCSGRYLNGIASSTIVNNRTAIRSLIIIMIIVCGAPKLQEEHSIIGDFSNPRQEMLHKWIKNNTSEGSVFAGKMALMANVMLSTRRPVVNNPYYESKEMRNRTMRVYEIFKRAPNPLSAYATLRSMGVDYVVLEREWCNRIANLPKGCQMVDLWDLVDDGASKARNVPLLCPRLYEEDESPFRRIYNNDRYVVLRLDSSERVTAPQNRAQIESDRRTGERYERAVDPSVSGRTTLE